MTKKRRFAENGEDGSPRMSSGCENFVVKIKPAEPAVCQMQLDFLGQLAF
jgi:hypothetical protein